MLLSEGAAEMLDSVGEDIAAKQSNQRSWEV